MPLSSLSVVVRVLPVPVGPTHNTCVRREGREGRERERKGERCHLHMYPKQQKRYIGIWHVASYSGHVGGEKRFSPSMQFGYWNTVCSLVPRPRGRREAFLSCHTVWVRGYTVCSSRSYRLGVCDEQLQHKVGAGGVDGGDDNVGESCVGVHHKGWHPFHPAHPMDLVKWVRGSGCEEVDVWVCGCVGVWVCVKV